MGGNFDVLWFLYLLSDCSCVAAQPVLLRSHPCSLLLVSYNTLAAVFGRVLHALLGLGQPARLQWLRSIKAVQPRTTAKN